MDADDLTDRCEREIEALHRFFTAWFRGAVPDADRAWSRVTDVLAPAFSMIAPEGRVFRRDELLAGIRARHGSHGPTQEFEIWIRGFEGRPLTERVLLATYEEWQRRAGTVRGRRSTAVFERAGDTPCGVRWLHVHETWLPAADGPAPPTGSPAGGGVPPGA